MSFYIAVTSRQSSYLLQPYNVKLKQAWRLPIVILIFLTYIQEEINNCFSFKNKNARGAFALGTSLPPCLTLKRRLVTSEPWHPGLCYCKLSFSPKLSAVFLRLSVIQRCVFTLRFY